MGIQDSAAIGRDELGHEDLVVAGENDQLDVGTPERYEQVALPLDALGHGRAVDQAHGHPG